MDNLTARLDTIKWLLTLFHNFAKLMVETYGIKVHTMHTKL